MAQKFGKAYFCNQGETLTIEEGFDTSNLTEAKLAIVRYLDPSKEFLEILQEPYLSDPLVWDCLLDDDRIYRVLTQTETFAMLGKYAYEIRAKDQDGLISTIKQGYVIVNGGPMNESL